VRSIKVKQSLMML